MVFLEAVVSTAKELFEPIVLCATRPWIFDGIFVLVEAQNDARRRGDEENASNLHKQI